MSKNNLLKEAQQKGYKPEMLEKVLFLMSFLERMNQIEYLREHLVLKGGTALNLFCFKNIPRLSVDIDFNYIGPISKEGLQNEREKIEKAILLVAKQKS
jgi:hypothetical protein